MISCLIIMIVDIIKLLYKYVKSGIFWKILMKLLKVNWVGNNFFIWILFGVIKFIKNVYSIGKNIIIVLIMSSMYNRKFCFYCLIIIYNVFFF